MAKENRFNWGIPGNPEGPHVPFGPAGKLAAVVLAHRGSVARKLLQGFVAIHHRHAQVQPYHVGGPTLPDINRFLPMSSLPDFENGAWRGFELHEQFG